MRCRAFTLIELLVVIGIIILLVAIVIPVLGFSRQFARSTKCASNIKQLTICMISYEVKNESFPHSFSHVDLTNTSPGGFPGNLSYDKVGWWWFNYISDYSRKNLNFDTVLWCPSRKINGSLFKYNVLVGNYGVNQSICKSWIGNTRQNEFTGSSLCNTDISSPSRTLLIVDSGYSTINWHHATGDPPMPLGKRIEDNSYIPGLSINKNRKFLSDQQDDAFNGRHRNKSVNVGFVDGHVNPKEAEDLHVEKSDNGYKNLSPLWLPM